MTSNEITTGPTTSKRCTVLRGGHKWTTLERIVEVPEIGGIVNATATRIRKCKGCEHTVREMYLPMTKKERRELWGIS